MSVWSNNSKTKLNNEEIEGYFRLKNSSCVYYFLGGGQLISLAPGLTNLLIQPYIDEAALIRLNKSYKIILELG